MTRMKVRGTARLAAAPRAERTSGLKAAARELGADLVGIADPARLAGEVESKRPQAIFPETASVIVIGRRITRGSLRGIEEGTNWNTFECFGRRWLEDQFLAHTAFELVSFIEDLGFEAVPLFGYPADMGSMGVPVRPGAPAPNVIPDVRVAAAAAGIGEIGRLGDLLTPEFGPLQRMSMILTDAELDHDEPQSLGFCEGCGACAEACPLEAVRAGELTGIDRGAAAWSEYAIDGRRCAACRNGAFSARLVGSSATDRIAAACGRACVASLEERGLLSRAFRNPFRSRPAWSVDAFGEVDPGGRPQG